MSSARRARGSGYPAGYSQSLLLTDGRRVRVRPVVPSDAAELGEAIRSADFSTRYSRFLGGGPAVTDALLDMLTRLDYTSHFALAAFADGRGVAVARYVVAAPGDAVTVTAEVAVAVAHEYRRFGLATALMQMLGRRADECGVTHFSALFLAENRPVMKLARGVYATVTISNGVAQLQVPVRGSSDH